VPVHDGFTLQAGSSHIFIAGDVSDDKPLLHEAADEGRIAGENAARFPDVRPPRAAPRSPWSSPTRRSPSWEPATPRSSRARS
jgi:pyruvate/2-oxoglutarate dehydrogenase complex dihydrolipoamide dehydrogenase (E3) component